MLDKTDETVLRSVDGAAPAIFVRMTSQVGPNRSIELSFGIPLDMRPKDLNAYLDKVSACSERQNNKGLLIEARQHLQAAFGQIEANRQHLVSYQAKQEAQWDLGNRRGDWKPTESQRAEIRNFETTERNLIDNIIPRIEKQIKELEEKINEDA